MPFIPHTPEDVAAMLAAINISSIDDVFDEIPASLPMPNLSQTPAGINEQRMTRLMQDRAPNLTQGGCFIGAGAYEHHIPAAVWDICSRGEFYTAYTPYQAEASQGSLQLIYEYQTMMAQLTGMQVSNASLYDGASALAEAVLMAVRIKKSKARRVIVPSTVVPAYRQALKTIVSGQDVVLEELSYDAETGRIDPASLEQVSDDGLAAVIIPQPNFFGSLEEVDELTNIAHAKEALVIAVVNPLALSLLKEPGQWGERGADIVCGEGQPLGVPLSFGGPYFGFMCTRQEYARQLPGRIVGCTHDANGQIGYTLTLQAREQHIRRAKATSNICTNQGLMVVAATIHLSLLGASGLREVALACHQSAVELHEKLIAIPGVKPVFNGAFFHEFVVHIDGSVSAILRGLAEQGLQGGYALQNDYSGLGECLLICVTETKLPQDLERYAQLLARFLHGGES